MRAGEMRAGEMRWSPPS